LTIRVDARGAEDPTAAALEALRGVEVDGAVVRVQIRLAHDQQAGLREREIGAALDAAASVTVSRQVEVEARARLGDLAPESLTPLQLVERYFQSRGETPERVQALLAKAEELLGDSG
jgi:SOS response regulatory protein OraA/RecX